LRRHRPFPSRTGRGASLPQPLPADEAEQRAARTKLTPTEWHLLEAVSSAGIAAISIQPSSTDAASQVMPKSNTGKVILALDGR